ncbi:MAG: HPr family phosphocarrier protein [Chloroflexi bacterium]|nr:HPr family phosphocarrier protein [Chloroflexota bacterium]
MAEVKLIVRNPSGLHARPAATFVRAAAGLPAAVRVTNLTRDPDRTSAANSLLGILALGVARGHEILISAEGDQAEAAVEALRALVESGLGEDLGPPEPG